MKKQECFIFLYGQNSNRMDTPFIYDRYVTGKNFIGRRPECLSLENLLSAGEHVAIYDPAKSGKRSLIHQTLFNMKMGGKTFVSADLNLFNTRTAEGFLTRFGSAAIRSACSTPDEYRTTIETFLGNTHFVFDQKRFSQFDEVVSLNWSPDKNDIRAMFLLPSKIAESRECSFIMILEEFQNILKYDGGEDILKCMEDIFREGTGRCSYILTGSMVNAMKYIFEDKKFFYRMVEHLPLRPVEDKDIIEYVVKGFLSSGKVIERDLLLGTCKLFRNNLWYINHFISICDSMSKGYINEGILMEALRSILSIHEPRFCTIMNNLTDFQISFLKAVLDGVVKFSSTEIIDKYGLNSSANVKRVKDALMKKEIITFNEREEPVIMDPLFNYWVEKYYFERG